MTKQVSLGFAARTVLALIPIVVHQCSATSSMRIHKYTRDSSSAGSAAGGKDRNSAKALWPQSYAVANSLAGSDGPGFALRGEHFDLYSDPIELGYGEVHFRFQPTMPLPEAIVTRFAGKHMAVTGYEINVVRVNSEGEEESVPAYDAYNHHYALTMKGSNLTDDGTNLTEAIRESPKARTRNNAGDGQYPMGEGNDHGLNSHWFSEGNGNEHRLSFHGHPEGHAQLIYSPDRMVNFFHLINTRGGGGRGAPGSSPLPRNSIAKANGLYSGLIECPCTDRRNIDVAAGTIDGTPVGFNCQGDLKAQNNTSCSLATYRGGLRCCEDGMVLLDSDQEQPRGKDTFFYKMRFWFEEAKPETRNLFRLFWSTDEYNGEYDIPQCQPKTQCVHAIKTDFTVDDMCRLYGCGPSYDPNKGFELMYASGHLHVGGISTELWNADTGELLCSAEPQYGSSDEAMDEEGYIVAIPPCLFSDTDPLLPDPPLLLGHHRLVSVAKYDSDPGHLGAMAFWPMRARYIIDP